MTTDDAQIEDDEFVYRRIPVSMGWYVNGSLSPEAFGPNSNFDATGISLTREKHKSPEEAARGSSRKGYYLAVLRVGDIRAQGLTVVYRPNTKSGHDPSHVEIPELKADNRKSDFCQEAKENLAAIHKRVLGPYPPTPPSDSAN